MCRKEWAREQWKGGKVTTGVRLNANGAPNVEVWAENRVTEYVSCSSFA